LTPPSQHVTTLLGPYRGPNRGHIFVTVTKRTDPLRHPGVRGPIPARRDWRNARVRPASAGPSGARTQGGRIAALFGRPRPPHRDASAAAGRAREFRQSLLAAAAVERRWRYGPPRLHSGRLRRAGAGGRAGLGPAARAAVAAVLAVGVLLGLADQAAPVGGAE